MLEIFCLSKAHLLNLMEVFVSGVLRHVLESSLKQEFVAGHAGADRADEEAFRADLAELLSTVMGYLLRSHARATEQVPAGE